ncbi:hypothetical protein CKO51_21555 [Rhodopirellula sp. SM50]|nr:BON domain-containing protein [Rhodopirellula sp. SM50]PAY17371.1 hypothetical protein CKO51_21555 [Rhodopirellula sp. SM50]
MRLNKSSLFNATIGSAALACLMSGTALHAANSSASKNDIKDDRIETTLEGEFWGAKSVDANAIDVTVAGGIVTLTGSVNNLMAKESAVRIAKMIKGVRSVVDRLEVTTAERTDWELERDVITALAQDPATDTWEISVSVKNGNVTLNGTVSSYAERDLAAKVARSTRGVTELTNQLEVNYDSDRTDYEIKSDIVQRLNWDARLDDELVIVEVEDGHVTLSGSVGSDYERTIARSDAWVTGVRSIDTEELQVAWWSRDDMQRRQPWSSIDDEAIADAIEAAFLFDPRVSSFNPNVAVDAGVVTLTGIVDNLKAKRAAAQNAKNTVGVWRVKNYLKVRPVEPRSSDAIKRDVEEALTRDPLIDRYDISINASNGQVYLYGDVDSYYDKEHAEDLAIKVNGVTDVRNKLQVDG